LKPTFDFLVIVIALRSILVQATKKSMSSGRRDFSYTLGAYAWVLFVAWFQGAQSFGLYAEDFLRISRAMHLAPSELLQLSLAALSDPGGQLYGYPTEGRPLHAVFIFLFSALGSRLGGLPGVYMMGYAIILVNAMLFWALVRRLTDRRPIALLAGLFFILFPADTTKTWLTASLGIQPALTFLLVALHIYPSRWRPVSYLLMAVSLGVYESSFPIFLAAPALVAAPKEQRDTWRGNVTQWAIHVALTTAILLVVFVLRVFLAENRVGELHPTGVLLTLTRQMLLGPVVSLGLFGYRALVGLSLLNWVTLLWCLPGAALIYWLLRREGASPRLSQAPVGFAQNLLTNHKETLLGVAMLILGYSIALFPSATSIGGRFSRVHIAASLGGSLVLASLASNLIARLPTSSLQRWGAAAITVLCSLQVSFGRVVQSDFEQDWQKVQGFWTEVVHLTSDAEDGDVIVTSGEDLNRTADDRFIGGIGYTHVQSVFDQLFQYPSEWKKPPIMVRVGADWIQNVDCTSGRLDLGPVAWEGIERVAEKGRIIYLESGGGSLTRRTAPFESTACQLPLKQQGTTVASFGSLYSLMANESARGQSYLQSGSSVGYFW
jgi:hypothetical protein